MNKITETFQSRKFWITISMFAMAVSLFVTGYLESRINETGKVY